MTRAVGLLEYHTRRNKILETSQGQAWQRIYTPAATPWKVKVRLLQN